MMLERIRTLLQQLAPYEQIKRITILLTTLQWRTEN